MWRGCPLILSHFQLLTEKTTQSEPKRTLNCFSRGDGGRRLLFRKNDDSMSFLRVCSMTGTKTKAVGVSLPIELLEKIDKDRGRVPRSVWIVELLEKALLQEIAQQGRANGEV